MKIKDRVIKALESDSFLLSMQAFVTPLSWNYSQYDLAGLILKESGYVLQIEGPYAMARLPLNAPLLDKQWYEFEGAAYPGLTRMLNEEVLNINATARQLWAADHGDESAKALPFYESPSRIPGTSWWDDLASVTTADMLNYLSQRGTPRINFCHPGIKLSVRI